MLILISLAIVLPLILIGKDTIKKQSNLLYVIVTIITAGIIYLTVTEAVIGFPRWVRDWIWSLFANGALATALWIVVMFTGALKNGSTLIKKLMPIRAELSIIASILTLGHNIAFGLTYFVFFFDKTKSLPSYQNWATISTMILMVIMIPLFITSFQSIRRKMSASKWKKMQRWAYLFYALTYVHVMLLFIPLALKGRDGYFANIVIYTVIFGIYAGMRITKALKEKGRGVKIAVWLLIVVGGMSTVAVSIPNLMIEVKPQEDFSVSISDIENTDNQIVNEDNIVSESDDNKNNAGIITNDGKIEKQEEIKVQPKEDKKVESKVEPKQEPKKAEPKVEPKEESKKAEPKVAPKQEPKKVESKVEPKQESEKTEHKVEPQVEPKQEPKKEEPKEEPKPEPVKIYKDGTFKGTGKGYNGPVVVSVIIKNDSICGISIVSHAEDEPYWTDCKAMMSRFLAAQSSNVATIAGATVSSKAMKDAVADALLKAKI